jgi:hypothetical protein
LGKASVSCGGLYKRGLAVKDLSSPSLCVLKATIFA